MIFLSPPIPSTMLRADLLLRRELSDLLFAERAEGAHGKLLVPDRADRDPPQFGDGVPDPIEHLPDLAASSLVEKHREPGVPLLRRFAGCRVVAFHLARPRPLAVEQDPAAEAL